MDVRYNAAKHCSYESKARRKGEGGCDAEAGETYSEILKEVKVAKSSLSLWFRDVGLAKKQVQRITAKRYAAQKRGAEARHLQRVVRSKDIYAKAVREVGSLSRRELWLVGTALYWAEGSKQHEHTPSVGTIFSNSDIAMHWLFMRWLDAIGIQMPIFILSCMCIAAGKERSMNSKNGGEMD